MPLTLSSVWPMAMLVGWEGATLKTSQKTCRRMFELRLRVTGKSYKISAEKCGLLAEYLFGDVGGGESPFRFV